MRRNIIILIFTLFASSIPILPGCKGGSTDNGGTVEDRPELKLEMVLALEGPGTGSVADIALDAEGNIYITGNFSGTIDMDPGTGTSNEIAAGGETDIFLAKYDPLGNYEWSVSWGAGGQESVHGMEIGPNGRIYIHGMYTGSVDFDPGPGTAVVSATGNAGKFVCRFNPLGGFDWVKTWEVGAIRLQLNGFCIDPDGRLIFAGGFNRKVDFDPGPGVFEMDANDGGTAFILALSGEGEFEWAVRWGEAYRIDTKSVATDSDGNIYVTGYFRHQAGETLSDIQAYFNETTWAYISKFNSAGEPEWWRSWGGRDSGCRPNFIGTASDGLIYVAGWYSGNVDLDPGPGVYSPIRSENMNMFMSGFDSAGDFTGALVFSERGMMPVSYAFGTDASVYWFGHVSGRIDLDPGPGEMFVEPLPTTKEGDTAQLFMINRYGPDGRIIMANFVSNSVGEQPVCFAVDESGNVYMGGQFTGAVDFDPGMEQLVLESSGEQNSGYFVKFTQVP